MSADYPRRRVVTCLTYDKLRTMSLEELDSAMLTALRQHQKAEVLDALFADAPSVTATVRDATRWERVALWLKRRRR